MDKKKNLLEKLKHIGFVFIVLILGLITLILIQGNTTPPMEISYEDFQTHVVEDQVREISINFDEDTFKFKLHNDRTVYVTDNPRYDDFKKDMLEKGIAVTEQKTKDYSNLISLLMPILIFGGFSVYLSKTMNGNNEKIGVQYDKAKKVTFKDVAGLKEVKEDLMGVVDFLKNPKKYKDAGAKPIKGVLFNGPPGTGKTLLGRAIAGEAGVNFISVSGSDFSNKFVGVGGDRVRKLFSEARKQKPCIIFIDEIDAVGGSRDGGMHSENRNTLNALLTEMDGFDTGDGILVIAATNRLEDLDSALVRPGRFDNIFAVPLPSTTEERREVIDVYARGKKFDESVDFNMMAKQMIGNSPADIEAVMNEASIIAAREHNGIITKADIDEAYLKKILKGHVKRDSERDMEQIRLVAYHEAGHTLVGTLTGQAATKVTILPSTSGAGGFTIFSPSKMGLYSKKELEDRVLSLYAGRAAEELLVGKENITTGASNDIERATSIINHIVSKYGMFEGDKNCPTLLDYSQVPGSDRMVMEAMNSMAQTMYETTRNMLEENRDKLDKLAEELIKKETLNETEILAIVKE